MYLDQIGRSLRFVGRFGCRLYKGGVEGKGPQIGRSGTAGDGRMGVETEEGRLGRGMLDVGTGGDTGEGGMGQTFLLTPWVLGASLEITAGL